MNDEQATFRVFISHSTVDTWVAKQIATAVEACGATTFLDEANIEYGDDFEAKILEAARGADELLVLLTPWATQRPYIWMEIGAFWGAGKRIVGVLQGLTAEELATRKEIPALLKRTVLLESNDLDQYFPQLAGRVQAKKK